jgi:hypothetical protein
VSSEDRTNITAEETTSRGGAGAVRPLVLPLSDDAGWRTIHLNNDSFRRFPMTDTLSLQQHWAQVDGVEREKLQALTRYSEHLANGGEQNLAFLVQHYGTLVEYYQRFRDVKKRLRMLIETLTEGAVTVGGCWVECPYGCDCNLFNTKFRSPDTGDDEPRLTGEVARIIENLLAPFERKLKQMNQKLEFNLLLGNSEAILRCEIWFFPALIAYLELRQEQQRDPGAATGTSPFPPPPSGGEL